MMSSSDRRTALRTALEGMPALPDADASDYRIAASLGPGFLARSRALATSLLLPLEAAPRVAGRRGGGFTLRALPRVAFEHDGRRWEQPAAVIECTEAELLEPFLVLVVDIADRLQVLRDVTWQAVLACVDEWQALLGRRVVLTVEQQLGLWAELWMIVNSADPDRLAAAWRGPDSDPVDFFVDGRSVDVKASRRPHEHHVSQRQVDEPVGEHDAYLVSMWTGVDPGNGTSLTEMVDDALGRVSDAGALLKRIAQAGYLPSERAQYVTRFVQLSAPFWFRVADVPRVRAADPGISQLRFVVTLDPERAVPRDGAVALWNHFCLQVPAPWAVDGE